MAARSIIPILLVLIAVGLFFGYIDGAYDEVTILKAQEKEFSDAIATAREVDVLLERLRTKRDAFSPDDLTRLGHLLPDHVDNVRLIIDINEIALAYGMRLEGLRVETSSSQNSGALGASSGNPYESVVLSFNITGSYDKFVQFLRDLEISLRIVDITKISFQSSDAGNYQYAISLKTYWLR